MNIDNAHPHCHLIAPHGGEVVDLKLAPENAAELKARSKRFSLFGPDQPADS
jgi:hypothetical protein